MRLYLYALVLSMALLSCGSGRSGNSARGLKASLIEDVSPKPGAKSQAGDAVAFSVRAGAGVDSLAVNFDGRRMLMRDGKVSFSTDGALLLGKRKWTVTAYAGGDSVTRQGEVTLLAAAPPTMYGYKIKNTHPHNPDSYTQGLLWHDGYFYESTGLNGKSAVMKVDLHTGRAVERRELERQYFGEGLAIVKNKLYQLTWQENTAFVYDLNSLRPSGRFGYQGEGWGLTSDGRLLYMSDGTSKIHVVDPDGFRRLRTIEVCTDRAPVEYLNELEWIDGEIWANVYTSSVIVRIDPATGAVTGAADLAGILPQKEITPDTDVLNGIAWDAFRRRIFVTGKNWSKLFEIELFEKK